MITDCNLMFGVKNLVLDAESVTISNPVAGFPASHMASPVTYEFCRSAPSDGESTVITVRLGKVKSMVLFGLIKHNYTSTGEWRIRVWYTYNDRVNGVAPQYDSGFGPISPGLDMYGALPWGTFEWGEFSFELYAGGFNKVSPHVLPERVLGSYIEIEIVDDEAIGTDGYHEQAVLWISDAWQPQHGAAYGSSISFTDATNRKKTPSGVTHSSKRLVKSRSMDLILQNEDKYQLLYNFVGPILATQGASVECFVVLQPLDTRTLQFETIYGFMQQGTATVTHSVFNRLSTNVSIEESV